MSNNLDLTQVAEAQANPEVPVNDKGAELDAALTEFLALDFTAGNLTVTAASYRRAVNLRCTNVTAARSLTLPGVKRAVMVENVAANTETVTITRGSATVALAAGKSTWIYTDGTTNGLTAVGGSGGGGGGGGGGAGEPNDLASYAPGKPTASKVVLRYLAVRDIAIPAALAGSFGSAGVAATASTVFDVQVNGVSVGSITFAIAGTVPTFTAASTITLAPGDDLQIIAPASPDATLADIAVTIAGTRAASTGLQPFDLATFIPGKPGAGKVVLRFNAVRAFIFQSGLADSLASALAASTGTATFDIAVNGVSVGSLVFTASATGVFTFASDVFGVPGDVVTITAPGTQDATLADVSLTILGSR